jgi:hypothetical protein
MLGISMFKWIIILVVLFRPAAAKKNDKKIEYHAAAGYRPFAKQKKQCYNPRATKRDPVALPLNLGR